MSCEAESEKNEQNQNIFSQKEPEIKFRKFSFRAAIGPSMGGSVAARLGLKYSEKLDFIGIGGTPIADTLEFYRMIRRFWLGGYCSLDKLEEFIKNSVDLNSEKAFCGLFSQNSSPNIKAVRTVYPKPLASGNTLYEKPSDAHNWWRSYPSGRGGNWTRSDLHRVFADLLKVYGNPFYEKNKISDWLAQGISQDWLKLSNKEKCQKPQILKKFYNFEYNPKGDKDVLTYCDGQETDALSSDKSVWARTLPKTAKTIPVRVLLAVDLNGNGKKDFAEPIIINDRERFLDYGSDGIKNSLEPGYDPEKNPDPAADNFNPFTNPNGTEGNFLYDKGESFMDFGLDGVDNTKDYGENNKQFDRSPGLSSFISENPSHYFKKMSAKDLQRLNIYAEAGIRDFLNSVISTNRFFGNLKARVSPEELIEIKGFNAIIPDGKKFIKFKINSQKIKKYTYVRYGDADASKEEIEGGNGDHLGSFINILNRFKTILAISQSIWPGLDFSPFDMKNFTEKYYGIARYFSKVQNSEREYSFILPPGYFENTDLRYPVVYFFHGAGMDHKTLSGFGPTLAAGMAMPENKGEKPAWGKFIIIFPNGKCPKGRCGSGTFYANLKTGEKQDRYEDEFFELFDYIDKTYRTKKSQEIKLKL